MSVGRFTKWRSLIDGQELLAIPDNVVDNFEDAGGDPAGFYEDGETLSDYYSGDTGDFQRFSTDDAEGDTAVERTSQGENWILSTPGDGLNRYAVAGETVAWLGYDPSGQQFAGPVFLGANPNSLDGYSFVIRGGDGLRIERFDGGFGTAYTNSASVSADVWYWCEADLPDDGDATIEFRAYHLSTNLERGDLIGSVSATDDTHVGNEGVGLAGRSTNVNGPIADWIRVIE